MLHKRLDQLDRAQRTGHRHHEPGLAAGMSLGDAHLSTYRMAVVLSPRAGRPDPRVEVTHDADDGTDAVASVQALASAHATPRRSHRRCAHRADSGALQRRGAFPSFTCTNALAEGAPAMRCARLGGWTGVPKNLAPPAARALGAAVTVLISSAARRSTSASRRRIARRVGSSAFRTSRSFTRRAPRASVIASMPTRD